MGEHMVSPLPTSDLYRVQIDGVQKQVFQTTVADFVVVVSDRAVKISIETESDFSHCLPNTKKSIVRTGEGFEVESEPGENLAVYGGTRPLYIFGSTPKSPPEGAKIFQAGFHDAGLIEIRSGETVWLEDGAYVRGWVRAIGQSNLNLGGFGILDGSLAPNESQRLAMFAHCQTISVSDLVMVNPRVWMLTFGDCDQVKVQNLHQIGEVVSSDGIDVVGSRHVRIEGGFLHNNDDCIVIKSTPTDDGFIRARQEQRGWGPINQDVYDVLAEGCILANHRAGNGIEIGHELVTERVSDITFRNIDILHCNGYGAPISIHNGDHAKVEDVLFEDIRIHHHYDKFLDLRIMKSRYSQSKQRGQIRNITFRNIWAAESPYNAGYTVSVIGGVSEEHKIEGLVFENLVYGERKIMSLEELDIFTRFVGSVVFK